MIVILSFLVGCNGGVSKEPGRYYDSKGRFSIRFPDSWKESNTNEPGLVVRMVSPEDVAEISVLIQENRAGKGLEHYLTFMETFFTRQGLSLTERGQTTIDDVDAHWHIMQGSSGDREVIIFAYYMLKDDLAYAIGSSAPSESFSDYEDEIETAAHSFRFGT
jgi:hypothetical protein